jgi:hypothetical protein
MPLIVAVLAMMAMFAFMVLMIPLSIVMRYRAGTSRRPARGWMITLNLYAVTISATIFLIGAGFASIWIPRAFSWSLMGLGAGFAAGVIGLLLTRWEVTPHSIHYTPSRILIVSLTLIVMARLFYGLWRAWNAWQTTTDTASWIAQSGAAGSMAAGGVIIGYYVVYWMGLRRRFAWHRGLTAREQRVPRA